MSWFSVEKFTDLKIGEKGITLRMTDPEKTTREDIEKRCAEFKIAGLTWRTFGNLIYFYKLWTDDDYDTEEEDQEEEDDE